MRNLKRALSLALASVMLLGMMVVGTSAASIDDFTDADSISNKEAVAIATGLGIFDGYDDGSFGPDKAVTRAEMAVVIAKILHGSDVDPSNFAGAGKFTDVPAWAEGYVNLVASLKIIEGVGDNKFNPNATVTTVEASTMLLKALGYFVDEETALDADWQLTVTSKATALGLYGDLSLGMNAPLTRENVAELTFNALFAQRVSYDDYRGLYVKSNDRNVVVTNGTNDEMNTLAQNTYGLYAVSGLVTANGMTDMYLEGKTEVEFDDDKDVTGDGKVESEYSFKYETGLNYIGHAVTVYYEIVKKAPAVYAIVDNATLAVKTTMTDNLSTLAKAEGFAKDTSDTEIVYNYDLEKDITDTYTNAQYDSDIVYLISNSSDLSVDYAIVVESTLSYVDDIIVNDADKDDPIKTYTLVGDAALGALDDDKDVIAVNEVEEKDYVLVTMIEDRAINGNDLYLIQTADTEIETIVTVTRKLNDTKKLASEAVTYTESITAIEAELEADNAQVQVEDEVAVIAYEDVLMEGEYILIYDDIARLIGVVPVTVDTTVNTAYVAQFGVKINTDPTLFDDYALYAHVYFADGTNGVYTVDTSDFTDNAFYGSALNTAGTQFNFKSTENLAVSSTGAVNVTKDEMKQTTPTATDMNYTDGEGYGPYIRLYDVKVQDNGKIRIKELPNQGLTANTTDKHFDLADTNALVEAQLSQIKKGVTWMGEESTYSTITADEVESYYGNSKTTFFLVDGVYNKTGDKLAVSVVTGMANVPTIDLSDSTKDNYGVINQGSATQKTGYKAMDYVLVNAYQFEEVIDGLYYYNEYYTIKDMKDGTFNLIFTVYDFETGEETSITYTGFDTDQDARDEALALANGYYTQGTTSSDTLAVYWVNSSNEDKASGDDNTYVVDTDFIRYIDQGDVLTLYTDANDKASGVTVTEDTIFVNLTSGKFDSLESMDRLIEARQLIWEQNDDDDAEGDETATLVYDYDENNNVGVIYVVDIIAEYSKDYTGSGSGNTDGDVKNVSLVKTGSNFAVEFDLTGAIANGTKLAAVVYKSNGQNGEGIVGEYSSSVTNAPAWGAQTDKTLNLSVAVPGEGYYYVEFTVGGQTVTTGTYYFAS